MAGAALLDLVDRRNGRRQVIGQMNVVRIAVAIIARHVAFVRAAAQGSKQFSMTLRTTVLVCQRFEVVAFMFAADIGMTVLTNEIRVCR